MQWLGAVRTAKYVWLRESVSGRGWNWLRYLAFLIEWMNRLHPLADTNHRIDSLSHQRFGGVFVWNFNKCGKLSKSNSYIDRNLIEKVYLHNFFSIHLDPYCRCYLVVTSIFNGLQNYPSDMLLLTKKTFSSAVKRISGCWWTTKLTESLAALSLHHYKDMPPPSVSQ